MTSRALQMYHALPPPIRSVAASVRGLHLKRWRYGAETDALVAAALERDRWSAERWKAYTDERLSYVLHRAATRVPFYRAHWAERRRRGDRASWAYLENWPILEKAAVRANPHAFVASDCATRRMFHEQTSGTTGSPLDLWWSRTTVREWYALFEARCRAWHGLSRHDRWGMIGGQLVAPVSQRRPPFWVWNAGLNQLYLSSYHLAPDLIPHYLDALARHRVTYLLGYTSSLYELAQTALRLGRTDLKLAVVLTNAEPVFPYQREAIAEAFQCPVRETYGMAEIVSSGSECTHGRVHLWPCVGQLEVVGADGPAVPGTTGDLIGTGLLNENMPLIRYRIGDRGAVNAHAAPCGCGRTLPSLHSVEGRISDVLQTADGRRIGRLDPVFKHNLPIHEAQIVQETLGRVRLRVVPAAGFSPCAVESIIGRLRERLGNVDVVVDELESVPRDANGKFRSVICAPPPEQRPEAAGRQH
jgi:phenylacetate-CoA ligase